MADLIQNGDSGSAVRAKLNLMAGNVRNWDVRNNLQKTRRGLNRVRSGYGDMAINLYGHSALMGAGAGSLSSGEYIGGAEPYSVASALARALTSFGISTRKGGWFGPSGLSDIARVAAYDARLAFGTGWSRSTSGLAFNSLGGPMLKNTTDLATSLAFTPTESWDTLDTYYPTFSGGGTFTEDIGASVLTTQSVNAGALGIGRVTTSVSAGVHTANTKVSALSSGVYLIGQETSLSTTPAVRVRNVAWSGATSADLAVATNPFSPLSALTYLGGDLTILECMRNDQAAGVPVATFKANLQAQITAAKAFGDVILLVDHAPKYWTFTNDAAFVAAIYDLSDTNNVPLLDIVDRIGDGTAADALGYFCPDNIHYTKVGWGDIGSWIGRLLACEI